MPDRRRRPRSQGVFWILTIPVSGFARPADLDPCLRWIRGQQETGAGGYQHWQIACAFKAKVGLAAVKAVFGRESHAELTKSKHANEYVWKEDTRVSGTQFEFGVKPVNVASKIDWQSVWDNARTGQLEQIPVSLRFRSYRTIRSIAADYAAPEPVERTCTVFYGPTGTGKSRRAWNEAGMEAYPKDPRSKFWCGYRGQSHIVIDEFRGGIDVSHMLRWLDRYPVILEVKGSSVCHAGSQFWITSNLHPQFWYPELDTATYAALRRRLVIYEFKEDGEAVLQPEDQIFFNTRVS